MGTLVEKTVKIHAHKKALKCHKNMFLKKIVNSTAEFLISTMWCSNFHPTQYAYLLLKIPIFVFGPFWLWNRVKILVTTKKILNSSFGQQNLFIWGQIPPTYIEQLYKCIMLVKKSLLGMSNHHIYFLLRYLMMVFSMSTWVPFWRHSQNVLFSPYYIDQNISIYI